MAASQLALQLRRDSLLTEAHSGAASSLLRRSGSNSLAAPAAQPPNGDAAIVSLSTRAKAQANGSAAASRTVAGGAGLLDAAEKATSKIDSLVTKLKSLAQDSEDRLLDPTTSAARESEAEDLLAEITTVESTAKYNGALLINSGAKSVAYDLDGSDANSANEIRLSVPNVRLSSTQLGLNALSGSSFTDSAAISDTLDRLDVASRITASTAATLSNADDKLSSFTENIGAVAGAEAELPLASAAENETSANDAIAQAAKTVSDSAKAPELIQADLLLASISQEEAIRRTTTERSTALDSTTASAGSGFSAVA